MENSTPTQHKPIHSLILDTGPLIKNAVSISTLINTAEELYTTPAILSEIRDEATRSRVQTTLVPFLKIRNPSPASYDAVIAFSKKTGDHAVLSRQDLGILALAYEVHCERNGGNWGLRETPKGEIKKRPEDIEREEAERAQREKEGAAEMAEGGALSKSAAKRRRRAEKARQASAEAAAEEMEHEIVESGDMEAPEDEGWEQPTGKRAAKAKAPKSPKFNFKPTEEAGKEADQNQEIDDQEDGGVKVTEEEVQEQIHEQVAAQVKDQVHDQVQDQVHEQIQDQIHEQLADKGQEQLESQAVKQAEQQIEERIQEQVQEQVQEQLGEQGLIEGSAAVEVPSASLHIEQDAEVAVPSEQQPEPATEGISQDPNLEQDMASLSITQQPTPPATDDSAADSDSDGDWITPGNLSAHQAKDSGLQPNLRTAQNPQLDVATMTTDFAMQNVLLQLNLHLLSTNMQRIKTVNTKVLRCHACFLITKQMDRQFCPRCGQATLQRVSCSTNAKGEFRIHLAKNYQYNKRGDRYSIPKPIAGTANTKWKEGQGGGKGGWGRDLILAEDQKEFMRAVEGEKRRGKRDMMDEDYLPGILTGERSGGRGAGGKLKVGAGRNVNAKKRS
ncbi:20s-pre-rrna d-site endonuclease nob1 [Curvularia clavata]|uniref:20s-pre-rrna d-site endonuclease nob1 n=1 Tax=Curvularia clavata TaxID=95742 RepID=A0A9Q8YZE3_CURCL|nr:20s-pre-rrna d-site endonuclease nob1 [Curvularia clavata]